MRFYVISGCTCLQYLLYFLLAAAAVHCTYSGDPSGEGFAFNNFLYMVVPVYGMRYVNDHHCQAKTSARTAEEKIRDWQRDTSCCIPSRLSRFLKY
jgi:hypothetical protein